ncbi:MAG: ABC transporter permease [Flavobacteriales bacterium]|jgi:phospholipid/cholesterol/gamma-HCH transport system permease protein|nr:ABC transporter permease [Flavobacteriales bacterium]MDG1426630.1 ABC transporter permease [Flavobacteriales bacterium]MDG2086764.1 ABC transporter permease [Flavobacteriales bacterium]|tara:strand:+ start:292 stop:1032 length:741 start_codon:yes stop_codon:yes gene_type:complete
MQKLLKHIGQYFMMMRKVMSVPEKWSVFNKQLILELEKIGLNSIGIVLFISFFVGGVVSIQTALNLQNPLLPKYLIGLASRDSLILEFSPTMISLILAGKVGSSIASEIGSMRVSEQIDALEIMGVNSASFLILPKIIASLFFFPLLVILSMGIGMIGAWVGGLSVNVTTSDFMYGLRYEFIPFFVSYAIIKTLAFAFIVSSLSSYFGYYAKGGAVAVGKSSTEAVVYSSIVILVFNFILTKIILA